MKKIFFIPILLLCIACNNKSNTKSDMTSETSVRNETDSLELAIHFIDSISNSGQLLHVDVYEIGKIRSVYFSVHSIQSGNDTLNFINLKKDCGNDYYYSWENAILLPEECKYIISSIGIIKENLKRTVDHEERYSYVTKDDIQIRSENTGNKWAVSLSVDYHKSNSYVSLSESEIDTLKAFIIRGQGIISNLAK